MATIEIDRQLYSRDYCRALAKKNGITLQSVGLEGAQRLHRILCVHVFRSKLFRETYSVDPIRKKDIYRDDRKMHAPIKAVELHVSSHYFTRREAITFNSDGFIGFCGWADPVNSQPVLAAFVEWCNEFADPDFGNGDKKE